MYKEPPTAVGTLEPRGYSPLFCRRRQEERAEQVKEELGDKPPEVEERRKLSVLETPRSIFPTPAPPIDAR
jgi:hypothetical protein